VAGLLGAAGTWSCDRARPAPPRPPAPAAAHPAAPPRPPAPAAANPDASLAHQADAAARRGIAWVLANQARLDQDFVATVLRDVARITPDDQLAQRMRAAASGMKVHAVRLAVDLGDPRYRHWSGVSSLVEEIARRRCVGQPDAAAARRLGAHLARPETAGLEPAWRPTARLIRAHYLRAAGLGPDDLMRREIDEVRALLRGGQAHLRGTAAVSAYECQFALTHIVFTASWYFREYPDPRELAPEIAQLRELLAHYGAAATMTDDEADIAAEVLTALKLVRVPSDQAARTLVRRLLARQQPDGSWGGRSIQQCPTCKLHNTMVMVQALVRYRASFRPDDCVAAGRRAR
jgi:hypothetical protein